MAVDIDKVVAEAKNFNGQAEDYFDYCGVIDDLLDAIEQSQKECNDKDELIFAYSSTRTPVIDTTIIDLRKRVAKLEGDMRQIRIHLKAKHWAAAVWVIDNKALSPKDDNE